ncbi:unnamed protein product [Phyllotreta striolata]|uniref:Uncharacterized protein n=1 Tax=Phyllotreta striolata TaxID=444603 RepID=A0A9N9TVU9_PHYSR|nr:unnamed protein product [Phyllotreta striolata]
MKVTVICAVLCLAAVCLADKKPEEVKPTLLTLQNNFDELKPENLAEKSKETEGIRPKRQYPYGGYGYGYPGYGYGYPGYGYSGYGYSGYGYPGYGYSGYGYPGYGYSGYGYPGYGYGGYGYGAYPYGYGYRY